MCFVWNLSLMHFAKAGHPLDAGAIKAGLALPILTHMRTGDISAFKPETQLQYVGHMKLGFISRQAALLG